MKTEVLTRNEFIARSKISEKLLREIETAKLIKPAGLTEKNLPFYTSASLRQIAYIKKLIDIGYTLEEVNRITRKVGLPKIPGNPKKAVLKRHLTIGSLAEKVGVSPRTIKHWEETGIIEADMRSDGGFRLYSEIYIYLCKLVKDLQLFGYSLDQIKKISDLFRTFLAIEANIHQFPKKDTEQKLIRMLQEIKILQDKINLLKQGIRRWEDLLNKKTKEITSFRHRNLKRVIVTAEDKNG